MSSIRIYELARKLKKDSKELVKLASDMGYDVKNHMSTLDPDQADALIKRIENPEAAAKPKPKKKPAAKPAAKTTAAKEPEKAAKKKTPAKPADKKPAAIKEKPAAKPDEKKKAAEKPKAADKKPQQQPKAATKKEQPAKTKKAAAPEGKKAEQPKAEKVVELKKNVNYTVAQLEEIFSLPATQLIKSLMSLGVMANINQPLDIDTVELLATQCGINYEVVDPAEEGPSVEFDVGDLSTAPRAPVITVLGHVDHGKTSLLDAIRKANVTAGEAGGITQHIGAYQVEHQGKPIVFIDTPGHEAFTDMRARGAQITDVAILVVAADEGVRPQTIEALNHAKAAGVPIIVAMNKMDKPGANPERLKQQLSQYELMAEDWGGDTIFVPVSAITGDGLDTLLEMILLVAEMQELKAAPNRLAEGTVIDAKLDKGRGTVATVLIRQGTLKVGDTIVCGSSCGKVRAMFDDRGQRVDQAGPSVPVEILGLSDVPVAGERFLATPDDKTARTIADEYSQRTREETTAAKRVSLDDMFRQMSQDQAQELNIVLKSDVQGTTEAIKQSLAKIEVKDINLKLVHEGVGAITASDVMLASASQAIIIGFNVRPDTSAMKMAEAEKVEIRLYRVIYDLLDDIKAALEGMLEPEMTEQVIGRVEVRNIFKHSRVGTIAGCYVTDGKITNNAQGRLLRDGTIVYEGRISSLKRFKEDVKEVSSGYECGIMLENYNDIKEGDEIEAFVIVEDKQ